MTHLRHMLLCTLFVMSTRMASHGLATTIESFDMTGSNNAVVFRADAIYSANAVVPSGGDRHGNTPFRNGYVVEDNDFPPFAGTAWGLISEDQSGNGNLLYNGTNNSASSDYTGLVWGSATPIAVAPNTDYTLSFYLTNSTTGPNLNPAIIEPFINNVALGGTASATGFFTDGNPNHRWQLFEFGWNSGTATTASIDLRNRRATGLGNDFGVDTISLTVIPEPSSILLLIGCGLAAAARRQR